MFLNWNWLVNVNMSFDYVLKLLENIVLKSSDRIQMMFTFFMNELHKLILN